MRRRHIEQDDKSNNPEGDTDTVCSGQVAAIHNLADNNLLLIIQLD